MMRSLHAVATKGDLLVVEIFGSFRAGLEFCDREAFNSSVTVLLADQTLV